MRRKSLSSNKIKSMITMCKIYRDYEDINVLNRIKNIFEYMKNATIKRISNRR